MSNSVSELVARHRKLKVQKDDLDYQMKLIRAELEPLVEANGKWTDDLGYAKIVTRQASVSFSNADVNRLAKTWAESEDPIVQICGKMLLDLRKETAGRKYLQVK